MADGARERREVMRQLTGLRGRLVAAEEALAGALAAKKRTEEAFDAASDQFDAAERALDATREARAQARRERYAARQATSGLARPTTGYSGESARCPSA